jgi:hypothetical protein
MHIQYWSGFRDVLLLVWTGFKGRRKGYVCANGNRDAILLTNEDIHDLKTSFGYDTCVLREFTLGGND